MRSNPTTHTRPMHCSDSMNGNSQRIQRNCSRNQTHSDTATGCPKTEKEKEKRRKEKRRLILKSPRLPPDVHVVAQSRLGGQTQLPSHADSRKGNGQADGGHGEIKTNTTEKKRKRKEKLAGKKTGMRAGQAARKRRCKLCAMWPDKHYHTNNIQETKEQQATMSNSSSQSPRPASLMGNARR